MKTVYKILVPICSLAVIPAIFFLPILHLSVSSSLTDTLMSSLGLREYSSLTYLIKMFSSANEQTQQIFDTVRQILDSDSNQLGAAYNTKGFFIAAAVFLVITLILALLVFVFALFTKKTLLTTCFAGGSILSIVIADKLFDAFAKPFLNGAVSLKNMMSGADIISGLVGNLVSVDALELAMAYQVSLILLCIAAIICVCTLVEKNSAK